MTWCARTKLCSNAPFEAIGLLRTLASNLLVCEK